MSRDCLHFMPASDSIYRHCAADMSSTTAEVPSIASLSKQISDLSGQILSFLSSSSQPEPNFSDSTPVVPKTAEYEALRAPLNDAALDLLRLINGPKFSLRSFWCSQYDLGALQVALDRGFFDHVPLSAPATNDESLVSRNEIVNAGASVKQIAEKAGMDEDRTARILRLLASLRIFQQVPGESERFQHTAASASIARDKDFHALVDINMDDFLKATIETSTLIQNSPFASDAKNSPFSTAYGASMYDYYEQNPRKGKRFAQAMSGWSQLNQGVSELKDTFPWASLKNGKVVDIGGGSGHISIALAKQYPSLRFVVQDISPIMLSQSQGDAIQNFNGRLTFQQYDFFEPQPIHDADAFLLRQCLHNRNDADCVKIIRAVVPALEKCKEGTPLLINEIIIPRSGTTARYVEHYLRQVDFCMLVLFGAKERTEQEFDVLLKEADPRLEIVKAYNNPIGAGLLQVHLTTKNGE